MEEIKSIIKDYLSVKETDYAILINGQWGCGKTYFIKNELFDEILKHDSFLSNKDIQNLKRKFSNCLL